MNYQDYLTCVKSLLHVYLFGCFVLLTTVVLFVCVCVCRCGAPHRYADSFCKQESLCVQVDLAKKKKKKKPDSGASACVYSCVCLPATHVSQCLCTC